VNFRKGVHGAIVFARSDALFASINATPLPPSANRRRPETSTPIDRAEINRQNASHSRGPSTPEGKRRVSLNALRDGLTGHTVVLPSEDLAAYQKHCGQFHTELKPQGLIESKCVQTIADTYWRLDRIRAMENSLFGLAVSEEPNVPHRLRPRPSQIPRAAQ
jgi:hypothetical protein